MNRKIYYIKIEIIKESGKIMTDYTALTLPPIGVETYMRELAEKLREMAYSNISIERIKATISDDVNFTEADVFYDYYENVLK